MRQTSTLHPPALREATALPIIMRMSAVMRATGLARSTIYKLMAQKRFPRHVKLGRRAVGWRRADLERWSERCADGAAQGPRRFT